MSRWYRAYAGTISDTKLGEASFVAEASRSVTIAVWHGLLESAAETQDGGRFDTNARRLAAALGEPVAVIAAVLAAFAEVGMVNGDQITNWQRRQFESDTSTERSRRLRERRRNGDATPMQRCATPPDTETENTDANASAPSGAAAVDYPPAEPQYTDDTHRLWGEGPEILASLGIPNGQARKMIGKWRQQTGDDCAGVLKAIQRARDARPSEPIPWITNALPPRSYHNDRPRRPTAHDNLIAGFAAVARRHDPGGGFPDEGSDAPREPDAHRGPTLDLAPGRGGDRGEDDGWTGRLDLGGGRPAPRLVSGY